MTIISISQVKRPRLQELSLSKLHGQQLDEFKLGNDFISQYLLIMRFLFILKGKIQGQKSNFKIGLKCVFVGNKTHTPPHFLKPHKKD